MAQGRLEAWSIVALLAIGCGSEVPRGADVARIDDAGPPVTAREPSSPAPKLPRPLVCHEAASCGVVSESFERVIDAPPGMTLLAQHGQRFLARDEVSNELVLLSLLRRELNQGPTELVEIFRFAHEVSRVAFRSHVVFCAGDGPCASLQPHGVGLLPDGLATGEVSASCVLAGEAFTCGVPSRVPKGPYVAGAPMMGSALSGFLLVGAAGEGIVFGPKIGVVPFVFPFAERVVDLVAAPSRGETAYLARLADGHLAVGSDERGLVCATRGTSIGTFGGGMGFTYMTDDLGVSYFVGGEACGARRLPKGALGFGRYYCGIILNSAAFDAKHVYADEQACAVG
jgi:hypothetical protein